VYYDSYTSIIPSQSRLYFSRPEIKGGSVLIIDFFEGINKNKKDGGGAWHKEQDKKKKCPIKI